MWNLKVIDTDRPLYLAIAEALERDIKAGILKSGDKMPTHRELAKIIGVNVTTVTRAYAEAEKRGLITATVGKGTFITSDLGFNPSLMNTETNKSGLIEMGLVSPLSSIEPDIGIVMERVIHKNDLSSYMKYTEPQGLEHHREVGANWVRQFGVFAHADNVIITYGAQHGLNCILSSLFEPGDRIAVDCLTYPGIKSAAKRCGIRLEGVLMDKEGMIPKDLKAVCKRHDIKGIYTVARMQNPTNANMSTQRRSQIAQMIKDENLILIEDDIFSFLADREPSTLTALIPNQSIYVASISKAFYAGLRVGFVIAPEKFYNRISQAVVDTVWMASPLNVEIACECIHSGVASKIISQKREEIEKRAALFSDKLKDYDFEYTPLSMYVWLKLPDFWSSILFEKEAGENGINVVSSEKFSVGSTMPPNYVRISLSSARDIDELEKGLDILVKVLRRESDRIVGLM